VFLVGVGIVSRRTTLGWLLAYSLASLVSSILSASRYNRSVGILLLVLYPNNLCLSLRSQRGAKVLLFLEKVS